MNGHVADSTPMEKWLYYDYASHVDALKHFDKVNLTEARVMPRFSSAAVRHHLQDIMKGCAPGVKVMDITAKVPTTSRGSLVETVRTFIRCRQSAEENPNILWYCQRTPQNTPAFVHLFAYGHHPEVKKSKDGVLEDATYGAIAFFRGEELTLPARLTVGSDETAAEVLASFANVGYGGFKCRICDGRLDCEAVVNGVRCRTISEMLISDCDHVFHPECMLRRAAEAKPDADKCPVCRVQLPWSTHKYRDDEKVARLAAAQGRSSHYLGDTGKYAAAVAAADEASEADAYMASIRAEYNYTTFARAGMNTTVCMLEKRVEKMQF